MRPLKNQLKIDKPDQNRLQSIKKIQNLLHLALLNAKKVEFKFAR
jgi:hypothetical protein